jgi:hypothetical protein
MVGGSHYFWLGASAEEAETGSRGGLECYRVPLSGAGREKGDLCLTTSWGQKLKIECKSRKELAKWIVEALGEHDAVIIKQDRGETYVLQRIDTFADMCQ